MSAIKWKLFAITTTVEESIASTAERTWFPTIWCLHDLRPELGGKEKAADALGASTAFVAG